MESTELSTPLDKTLAYAGPLPSQPGVSFSQSPGCFRAEFSPEIGLAQARKWAIFQAGTFALASACWIAMALCARMTVAAVCLGCLWTMCALLFGLRIRSAMNSLAGDYRCKQWNRSQITNVYTDISSLWRNRNAYFDWTGS